MMFEVHSIVMMACHLTLLVVVLRCRRFELPRLLPTGAILCGTAQIFPFVTMIVGMDRVNEFMDTDFIEDDESIQYFIDDLPLCSEYFHVSQTFGAIEQTGLILLAFGFLKFVRQQIELHHQHTVRP